MNNNSCIIFIIVIAKVWVWPEIPEWVFLKLSILCQINIIFIILLYIILTNNLCVFADGPLNVKISGPDSAKAGVTVSLTCFAESRPDCDFHWFLNSESSVALKAGPVLTFSAKKGGKYTCKARNPVTNITMYQTKAFTVTGEWALLLLSPYFWSLHNADVTTGSP